MNFLVVVSVPFTTKKKKARLLLKGERLKVADASIKCLTPEEIVKEWGGIRLFPPFPKVCVKGNATVFSR